jgi:hypothetical protein
MPDHLREALAGRPLNAYPPGSRLTVRVEEVYLSHDGNLPFAGGGRGGMKMPDFISGSMQVTDARGRVLFERRLEVASPVQAGGPAFRADNEMRRVSAMMAAMADWAVRSAQR